MLIGEGKYNLNTLKEIKATDAYVGLGKDVTNCQNEESLFNCTTRQRIEAFQRECGCLPFSVRISSKVNLKNLLLTGQLSYCNFFLLTIV